MGILRLLFAMSVVLTHVHTPYEMVGGRVAVECFYLISGFLISLIWTSGKYTLGRFYLNRALRIYPVYYAAAGAALILDLALFGPAGFLGQPASTQGFIGTTTVTLFGQGWHMFLLPRDSLNFILLPQAWTLDLELTFYLIAPFIVGRTRLLLAIVAVSQIARLFVAWKFGLWQDPWSYRFFPFEIGLFAMGALSHSWLLPRVKAAKWALPVTCVAVGVTLAFPLIHAPNAVQSIVAVPLMFLALPFVFAFQKGRGWDSKIGELSYPLYLVHWPVMVAMQRVFDTEVRGETVIFGVTTAILSLGAAVLVNATVSRAVEHWRDRVRAGQSVAAMREVPA